MHRTVYLGAAHVAPFPLEAKPSVPAPPGAVSPTEAERPGDQVSGHVPDKWTCPYDLALRILLP